MWFTENCFQIHWNDFFVKYHTLYPWYHCKLTLFLKKSSMIARFFVNTIGKVLNPEDIGHFQFNDMQTPPSKVPTIWKSVLLTLKKILRLKKKKKIGENFFLTKSVVNFFSKKVENFFFAEIFFHSLRITWFAFSTVFQSNRSKIRFFFQNENWIQKF